MFTFQNQTPTTLLDQMMQLGMVLKHPTVYTSVGEERGTHLYVSTSKQFIVKTKRTIRL